MNWSNHSGIWSKGIVGGTSKLNLFSNRTKDWRWQIFSLFENNRETTRCPGNTNLIRLILGQFYSNLPLNCAAELTAIDVMALNRINVINKSACLSLFYSLLRIFGFISQLPVQNNNNNNIK